MSLVSKQTAMRGPGLDVGPMQQLLRAFELPAADPAVSADSFGRAPQLSVQLEALFLAFEHTASPAECVAQLCVMHPSYWYEALRRRLVCAVSEQCAPGSVNCPVHVIVHGLLVEDQGWTTQEKIEFVFDGLRAHIAHLQSAAAQGLRSGPVENVCGARFDIMSMHAQNVQLAASVSFLQGQAAQHTKVIESLQWTATLTQQQHAEQSRHAEQRILAVLEGMCAAPGPAAVAQTTGAGPIQEEELDAGLCAQREAAREEIIALQGELGTLAIQHKKMAGETWALREEANELSATRAGVLAETLALREEVAALTTQRETEQRETMPRRSSKNRPGGGAADMRQLREDLAEHESSAAALRDSAILQDRAFASLREDSVVQTQEMKRLREEARIALRETAKVRADLQASLCELAKLQENALCVDKRASQKQSEGARADRMCEEARIAQREATKLRTEVQDKERELVQLREGALAADKGVLKMRAEAVRQEKSAVNMRAEVLDLQESAAKLRAEALVTSKTVTALRDEAIAATHRHAKMHTEALCADKVISKLLSDAMDSHAAAPRSKPALVGKDAAKRPRLVSGARKSIARLRADELALRRTTAAVLAQPPGPHCSAAEKIASLQRTVEGQEMFLNLATHLLAQCDAAPSKEGTENSAACRQEVARLMADKNWEFASCPLCEALSGPDATQPRRKCDACNNAGTALVLPHLDQTRVCVLGCMLVCVCMSHVYFAQ
jgi:hypothetical protein